MSGTPNLTLSPYCPVEPSKYNTYTSPEGGFRPVGDGSWPLYPMEFTNWWDEEMSWHDGAYIHCGLNPFIWWHAKSKDFCELLSSVAVNTFNQFPVGKARHTVICTSEGKIMIDGITIRTSEDDYDLMCLPDPQVLNMMCGNRFEVESEFVANDRFFFQMCGPRTLEIVEQACKKDLHDLKFMWVDYAEIDGAPVRILRTGMAGTLGYEVHGNIEDATKVYNALMEAGKDKGIRQLGRHAYRNTHTDGSIPQGGLHFKFNMPVAEGEGAVPVIYGSLPRDNELVHRSPFDLGWDKLVRFNHEFPGKDALQKEAAGPHRTAVHLIWDPDDICKVIRASFEPGEKVDPIDFCEDWSNVESSNATFLDAVYDGDKFVGASSGRMFVPWSREMMSIATVDQAVAEEGKVLEVLWGNPGTRQMRIRAKVMCFPYIREGRNENFDIESIPRPVFE